MDDREEIVKLMRNAAGELPYRIHLFRLQHLSLKPQSGRYVPPA
jgi:hypothetical protein